MTTHGCPRALVTIQVALTLLALGCARPRAIVRAGGDTAVQAPTAPPAQPAVAPTAGCRPVESAVELRRRLETEASQAFAFRAATPLLVDRWPAPTAIVLMTYESRARPTARISYTLRAPEWRLAVGPLGTTVQVKQLPQPAVLGREFDHLSDELRSRLAEAEQALVEAVAGCPVGCDRLAPYQEWADAHPVLGRHLATRPDVALPCGRPR